MAEQSRKKPEEKELKLKLKFDESGSVALNDNDLPVWYNQDGEEVVFDVAKLYNDKTKANAESASRRHEIQELKQQLSELQQRYEGIEDPDAAIRAIETLQNMEDKQLMDTEGVESVKRQMKEAFQQDLEKQRKDWEEQLSEKSVVLDKKSEQIRTLLIKSAFDGSEYLRNETLLPPDVAHEYFKRYFEVREIEGHPVAVGKFPTGEDIISKRNPGELASPEEAIEILVEKSPFKDSILKGKMQSGTGMFSPDTMASEQPDALATSMYPTMKNK